VSDALQVVPMKQLLQACLATALLGLACTTRAAATIELKDGSRIAGQIEGIDHGVYTVRSASLGTVRVAESNIARIDYGGDVASAAGAPATSPGHGAAAIRDSGNRDLQELQARIAQDPSAMQSIMSLESDPQVQAVLNDPAIMKAIAAGDFASLMRNEKIQALESNETLKQLVQQQAH
jgi:hypothetical protein